MKPQETGHRVKGKRQVEVLKQVNLSLRGKKLFAAGSRIRSRLFIDPKANEISGRDFF